MGSIYNGNIIKLSLFGESHGDAVGIVIDGFPHGIKIDDSFIESEMNRRKSKNASITTGRMEPDDVKILSGILNNTTTGMPIASIIENTNKRSADYENLKDSPRPSHADYTASVRYNNFNDIRGGGHFSARLTAPIVFGGALAKIALKEMFGVEVAGHIKQIYDIEDIYPNTSLPSYEEFIKNYDKTISVFSSSVEKKMLTKIEGTKKNNDSVGGIITLVAFNVPAGLGDPFFSSIESRVSSAMFAVPAVKGVEFGLGFNFTNKYGSECNDLFTLKKGKVVTKTNNNGGINGGISNGMPIVLSVVLKPTPSIAKEQITLNMKTKKDEPLSIKGRHDPSVIIRALPILESMLAITLLDINLEMICRRRSS